MHYALHSGAFVALAALTACAAPRPSPEAESAIALATGVAEADVVFRVEGGPLDEPSTATEHLSLAEAVRSAVTTDPGLQAALAAVRIAIADADQARLLPNPVLALAVRFPEGGGPAVIEASLAQDIVSILRLPREASAADNRMRQAAADAVVVAIDLASDVQERYATVQALDELSTVLDQRRALVAKVVAVAHARLEAQEGTRDDLVILQSQLAEIDLDFAERDAERRDERLRLARLIGEPSGAATWTLDAWTAVEGAPASEAACIETALVYRPEVQSIAWQLEALGDDEALAGLFPFDGTEVGIAAERDGDWSVGPEIAVPIPLLDMGQARKARVTAEQIEARHLLTQARRQVVEDVRRSYESLLRARANLDRLRAELIPLQQQRHMQAESAYRRGFSDVTPLLLAEQDLRAAEARQVDLQQTSTIAFLRLQRAVGGAGVLERVAAPDAVGAAEAVAGRDEPLVRTTEIPK